MAVSRGCCICIPVSPELALSRTERLAGTAWDFTEVIGGVAWTVRVQCGPVEVREPWRAPPRYMLDIPCAASLSVGPGVAGWDPLAGKVNLVFFRTFYQVDYDGGDTISGCAYHSEDLFEDVRGPCHPLTGRRL